jgi:hypothetical protein
MLAFADMFVSPLMLGLYARRAAKANARAAAQADDPILFEWRYREGGGGPPMLKPVIPITLPPPEPPPVNARFF